MTEEMNEKNALTDGQKWAVAKLVITIAVPVITVFGGALYFLANSTAQSVASTTASAVAATKADEVAKSVADKVARQIAGEAAKQPAEAAAKIIAEAAAREVRDIAREFARDEAGIVARQTAKDVAADAGARAAREIAKPVAETEAAIAAKRVAEEVARDVAEEAAQRVAQDKIVAALASDKGFVEDTARAAERSLENAVIAFDTESKCPEGWDRFWPATSRVIIGAAVLEEMAEVPAGFSQDPNGKRLTPRPLREALGEEKVALKIEELPSHRHLTSPALASPDPAVFESADIRKIEEEMKKRIEIRMDGARGSVERVPYTNFAGGVEAHNNLPPYIGLYFCKKEKG
ncbi:MAG: hypothetical protein QNJ30_23825 [Kiloniellales bacterium]|nr:hypothetical protein [Kiloniellales bacterium]